MLLPSAHLLGCCSHKMPLSVCDLLLYLRQLITQDCQLLNICRVPFDSDICLRLRHILLLIELSLRKVLLLIQLLVELSL